MPLMDTYGPDMMKQEARTEFVNWYRHRKEIMRYCRSDVDILRCCLKFRTFFRKNVGLIHFYMPLPLLQRVTRCTVIDF